MSDSAMDDRKKSFQVKMDFLILECNIACRNINAVMQHSSNLVAYLLNETDHMQFSKCWPVIMAGLDASIRPITEFNCLLDTQLRALPSLETFFPAKTENYSKSCDVSIGREDDAAVVQNFENVQLPVQGSANVQQQDVQDTRPNNTQSTHTSTVQVACTNNTTNLPLPTIKQHVIREGSVMRMVYLNGDSPVSFWLRFESDGCLSQAKQLTLERFSTSSVKTLDTYPSVGDYVCTVVDNSTVVRGEVRNMKKGASEKVKVVLLDVDSGSILIVDSSKLWKLEPELAAIPAQAVHCRLTGDLGAVPPHAFVDICTDRHLEVKFCSRLKGNYPYYAVELYSCDPESDSKINVNKWVTKFFGSRSTTIGVKVSTEARSLETEISTTLDTNTNDSSAFPVSSIEVSASSNTSSSVKQDSHNSTLEPLSVIKENIQTNSLPVLTGEIVHVVTPTEFYMHMGRNSLTANNLREKMKQYYLYNSEVLNSKKDAMQKVGIYCACLFNKVYYRVRILDWMVDDPKNVCVKFMDYGYTNTTVPLSTIYMLHSEFADFPELASRCHLSNVLPADQHGKVCSNWTSAAVGFFNEQLQQGVQYMVYIAQSRVSDPQNSLAVLLVDEHDNGTNIINDTLVSSGHAVSMALALCNGSSDDIQNFNPMVEDYESALNRYDHDVEDARFVVSGWKSTDEEQVCPLFRRHGYCRRPPGTCMKKHISLDPNGIVTDKEVIYYKAFSELQFPESTNFRVVLTAADSLSVLYCVLVKEVTDNGEEIDAEEEETLSTLTRYMNEANNVRKMTRLLVPPALGQVVIAKHWDGMWHRAIVVDWVGDRVDSEEVVVRFTDSGEKLSVLESDLRNIESKYLHLPFQAFEFRLVGLKLDTIGKKESEWFLKKIQSTIGMEMSATIISWSPSLELVLHSDEGELVRMLEDQFVADLGNFSIEEDR